MRTPIISVIMPVYNTAHYLKDSIGSILAQTFDNYEFIIIDDGSNDESNEIIKEYMVLDKRIKVIEKKNSGISDSLNVGIDAAIGKYIARMDSDDISYINRFEKQISFIEENNCDFCGTWAEYFGAKTGLITVPKTHEGCVVKLLFGMPFIHPTVIGKTNKFKEIKYRKYSIEDYDFFQRAKEMRCKFGNTNDVLLKYRVRKDQFSEISINNKSSFIESTEIRTREWATYLDKNNISDWNRVEKVLAFKKPIYYVNDLLCKIKNNCKTDEEKSIIDYEIKNSFNLYIKHKIRILLIYFGVYIKFKNVYNLINRIKF